MCEDLRFELLLDAFKVHESLDPEKYNIEFAQWSTGSYHNHKNVSVTYHLLHPYLSVLTPACQAQESRPGLRKPNEIFTLQWIPEHLRSRKQSVRYDFVQVAPED
ncbi:hypothetical protein AHF37_12296 [Paragonimus kellicotti]|nr:hypothetical protein AHF37_12296 [Paragonimus kellicotti]